MKNCKIRGCRELVLKCEECGRVVSSYGKQREPEGDEWFDVETFPPEPNQPCEYKISVACKGWYRPTETEPRFAPDDRDVPTAQFVAWRPWKEAPTFDEGVKLVREFREKAQAQSVNIDGSNA